jgi:hypothetical protein
MSAAPTSDSMSVFNGTDNWPSRINDEAAAHPQRYVKLTWLFAENTTVRAGSPERCTRGLLCNGDVDQIDFATVLTNSI